MVERLPKTNEKKLELPPEVHKALADLKPEEREY